MGHNGLTANHGMTEITHEATKQAIENLKEILGEYKGNVVGCPYCGTEYKLQRQDSFELELTQVRTLFKDFQKNKCPHCEKHQLDQANKNICYTFELETMTIECIKLSIFKK